MVVQREDRVDKLRWKVMLVVGSLPLQPGKLGMALGHHGGIKDKQHCLGSDIVLVPL